MSVATLPSRHAAGNWSAVTPIPFTVSYTPVSGHSSSHNVTRGDVDDDTAKNTAINNRMFDNYIHDSSTADRFGGSSEMIRTKITVENLEHFLRSAGPDARKNEKLISGVEKVLKEGSEFYADLPTDLELKFVQKRREISTRANYVLEEEDMDAARAYMTKAKQSAIISCMKWLKGEDFPDTVEAELDCINIHNFLKSKKSASLASNADVRKAVQKVLLGSTATIILPYDDKEALSIGWKETKELQHDDRARHDGDDEDWRAERMIKTRDLAKVWYNNAGISDDEWLKSLSTTAEELRPIIAQQEEEKKQRQAKAKAKAEAESKKESEDGSWSDTPTSSSGDGTVTTLNPLNVDFFLQNFSDQCESAQTRAAVFAATQGQQVKMKLPSKDIASKITASAMRTSEAVTEFQKNKDEKGFEDWGKARQEKIEKWIKKWETDSKTSFEDWGKPLSFAKGQGGDTSAGGGGRTAPTDTANQTQTQPSSPSASPSPSPSTTPSSRSKFDMSDLKDTVITKYNLPELLSCYTNPEKASSFEGIQSFLYEALPPNHKKTQNILSTVPLLPEPTTATAQSENGSGSGSDKDKKKDKDENIIKLKLPSKFSDHLTKITSDALSQRESILKSSNGDENSEQMRLFDNQKNHTADTIFKNWKACHTKSDRTPLSSSSTSIPGETRKPISPAKKLAMTYDKNKIKQVDQHMSDPSTGPCSTDDEWQTNMHALQTADGYGKHGLRFDQQDTIRGKRTWGGLSSDGGSYWEGLNSTYLGSGGSSAATPMVTATA